jgi:hypothetical protein
MSRLSDFRGLDKILEGRQSAKSVATGFLMRIIGNILACGLATMCLAGCGTKTVMAPNISPDTKVHAVLEQTAYGGAAGGTEWVLYLSDANGSRRHRSLEAHNCNGMGVTWIDSTTLRVNYPHWCHIETFDSVWLADPPDHIPLRRIDIVLNREEIQKGDFSQ